MVRGQFGPTTPEDLVDWLLVQIEDMESEATRVYTFAKKEPPEPRGLFVQTLYAYMARCFSILDRLSVHWLPDEGDQTGRMVEALVHWAGVDREAANIGIQLWRHGLMHTAEARMLKHGGQVYRWLLQWGPNELPEDQNWTFALDPRGERILNLSLLHLISDLHVALDRYAEAIARSPELRQRSERGFRKVEARDQITSLR